MASSMKDTFYENTQFTALLCGKNVNFSVFKKEETGGRRGGGNSEIWTDATPVHLLPPLLSSLLSFSFSRPVWLSAMCFSLSVPMPITLSTLGRHIFHAPKPLKTKYNFVFFLFSSSSSSQHCLFFPESY